jgi:hypothetical protein
MAINFKLEALKIAHHKYVTNDEDNSQSQCWFLNKAMDGITAKHSCTSTCARTAIDRSADLLIDLTTGVNHGLEAPG